MGLEINNVVLGGHLTKDVVLKDTPAGRKVCSFAVAANNTYVSSGEKRTETSFIDVDVWGVIAENCSRYLKKGSPVVVIGRLKQERWETENGDKRSRVKIVAANVQFLPSGSRDQPTQGQDVEASVPVGQTAWDE
jgi:single-strand DNA-binding protein